jgi:hypothetical protein
MANETTTTTMNDIVYSAVIEAAFLDYAYDWVVSQQFFRRFSLIGKPSAALQIPRLASDMGTVGANGSGVDAEYDATQATDLSANIALDTDPLTLTAAEYGFKRTITDNVNEDSVAGLDLSTVVISDAARVLMTALEFDCLALNDDLSNVVGTSTVDLTIANMLDAQRGIRERGARAVDGVVYVLDDQQVVDLEAAIIATNAAAAVFALSADRILGVDKTVNNGMGNGHVLNFRGFPVYSTGLGPTANAGADVTGACYTPSTEANNPHATFGLVEKRMFRVETERDASLRADEIVFTMRTGVGELADFSGTAIITDAP